MKKDLLRQASLISWYQVMINRFKQRTSTALITLQQSRYTMSDARSGKDSRLFAQNIFRSAKAINMKSIHNQLIIAWNNLNWRFRVNILELTIIINVRKFLKQLNFMTNIWHEMTRSQNQNFKSIKNRFQNSRRIQKYSAYFFWSNSFSFYQRSVAYFNNQSFYQYLDSRQNEYRDRSKYRNRDIRTFYQFRDIRYTSFDSRYLKKKSQSFDSVLFFAKQSFQIIDENLNASDFFYSEIKNKNQYKNNKYQKNYKEKERAYVIEKDEQENEMKNISKKKDYYHQSNSDLNYYDSQNQDDEVEANFSILTRIFRCRKCKTMFFSNNQLHKHLRQDICMKKSSISQFKFEETTTHLTMNILIVEFTIDSFKNIEIDFEFRDWIYVKIMISLSIKDNETQICLDTDCNVILTNKIFIKNHEAHYIIRRMITSLNVRKLNTNKHEIWEYIIVIIYFLEKINQEKFVREVIRQEVHSVDNLKANMLIDNDILESEDIFIDDVNNKAIIFSCNMIISIEIRIFFKNMITNILHARFITIIFSHSMIIISIYRTSLSSNRDFLFASKELNVFIYAHIIDTSINAIMTKNHSNRSMKISRNFRLEVITKI
jgi:hypothetical protein